MILFLKRKQVAVQNTYATPRSRRREMTLTLRDGNVTGVSPTGRGRPTAYAAVAGTVGLERFFVR